MSDTPKGFIVFTGRYEVYYDLDTAETRLEELLDEGHNSPTVINSEPLGLSAHKVINTSSPGEIR